MAPIPGPCSVTTSTAVGHTPTTSFDTSFSLTSIRDVVPGAMRSASFHPSYTTGVATGVKSPWSTIAAAAGLQSPPTYTISTSAGDRCDSQNSASIFSVQTDRSQVSIAAAPVSCFRTKIAPPLCASLSVSKECEYTEEQKPTSAATGNTVSAIALRRFGKRSKLGILPVSRSSPSCHENDTEWYRISRFPKDAKELHTLLRSALPSGVVAELGPATTIHVIGKAARDRLSKTLRDEVEVIVGLPCEKNDPLGIGKSLVLGTAVAVLAVAICANVGV